MRKSVSEANLLCIDSAVASSIFKESMPAAPAAVDPSAVSLGFVVAGGRTTFEWLAKKYS
jgi:hypothetical protein